MLMKSEVMLILCLLAGGDQGSWDPQNPVMVGVRKHLWKSSSPVTLLKQGHPQEHALHHVIAVVMNKVNNSLAVETDSAARQFADE